MSRPFFSQCNSCGSPRSSKRHKAICNPAPQALSVGEETFALHCQIHGLTPTREHRFCERGWRFDFAWPEKKIAVEVEGGTSFGRSRHSMGTGFEQDAAKYNMAARLGWIVLRYPTRIVTTGEAIDEVLCVLRET